jgi:hypothetical protein
MDLLQFQNRPTRRADGRPESYAIDLHHWIRGLGRTKRQVVSLASPCRKGVDNAGNALESLTAKERYLILAFYL